MNLRKRIKKSKYAIVFGMTITIFLFGLLVGSVFTSQKLADVRDLQDGLRSDTLDLEVVYTLLEQNPCEYVNMSLLVEDLQDVAERVDYLEGELGKDDENVLRLKKYYSLLQLRQWLFEERVRAECAQNKTVVLYFYDNEPGACPNCEEQGFILSYLRKKYPEQLSVYSFDVKTESEAVQAVIRRYGINSVPTVVLNEELLTGFQSTEQLEELIIPAAQEVVLVQDSD